MNGGSRQNRMQASQGKNQKDEIQLSNHELWYLLTQLPPSTVIGFRNPMLGMLTEDMFPLAQEAASTLLDRQIVYLDAGSRIAIREDVRGLLQTLASPEHTFLAGNRLEGQPKAKVQAFNFEGSRIVLLEELPNGDYLVKNIKSRAEVLSLLNAPFADKVYWAPDSGSLSLSRNAMLEMQGCIESGDPVASRKCLEQAVGDDLSREHFWRTFQSPQIRVSLIGFLDRRDLKQKRVDGFTVLADDHYVWILDILDDDQGNARLSKITLKELNSKIDRMIRSVE